MTSALLLILFEAGNVIVASNFFGAVISYRIFFLYNAKVVQKIRLREAITHLFAFVSMSVSFVLNT